MTPATNRCPQCDQPLPGDVREGLCPACLLAGALALSAPGETLEDPNAGAQTLAGASKDQAHWPRIARYRILHLIDVGGMGEVYAAEQQQPHRTVALKVIRAGLSTHRNLQRFAYEAEALARLHHPGIAQVYESGTADSGAGIVPFFAMELVHGVGAQRPPTLTRYAQEHKLGTRQRLELLAKVADAVHHAHQNGVIHRDLKPSNVLVDETGQPKVLDFGVARVTDADVQAVTLQTDVGQIIGTLPYMSPEQAGGDPAQIDTRTDVYGLGALAYELLTGRPPLEMSKMPLPDAVRMIREEEPKTLSSIHRSLRGDVETIVAKALAKEKQRRYASAAEFAADIRRYLAHEPIAARPASARYQLAKFARRNKAVVAGTAGIMLALVIGTITTSLQAKRARERTGAAIKAEAETRVQLRKISELTGKIISIYDQVVRVPGTHEASKALVATANAYLDDVSRDLPKDWDVQFNLMMSYDRIGRIGAALDRPGGSVTKGSLECFQKALAIEDQLLAARPGDVAIQVWKAQLLGEIAIRHHRMSNDDDSLKTLQAGVDFAESLRREHPNDSHVLKNMRTLLEDTGVVVGDIGKWDDGLKALRQARDLSVDIHSRDPTENNLISVARNYRQVAQLELQLNDPEAALKDCREGLRLLESVQTRTPHVDRLSVIWALLDEAANAQIYLHQSLEGYDQYPTCLKLAQELAKDQSDIQAQCDLVTSYNRVSKLAFNIHEFDVGIRFGVRAREIANGLAASDPLNLPIKRLLTISNMQLGAGYGLRAALGAKTDEARIQDLQLSKNAILVAQGLAVECDFTGPLDPSVFANGISENETLQKLPRPPDDPALRVFRQAYTPAGEPSASSTNLTQFIVENAEGKIEWRQLNEQFWETRRNGVVLHRFRVLGILDDGHRKGVVLRNLVDGESGLVTWFQFFIPSPLLEGAAFEKREVSELPWHPAGTIHKITRLPKPGPLPAEGEDLDMEMLAKITRDIGECTEKMAASPKDIESLISRGRMYAMTGQFKKAAIDLNRAIDLKPQDQLRWHEAVPLLAWTEDVDGYRARRSQMLNQFAACQDANEAHRVVKDCLMLPANADEVAKAAALAEFALQKLPDNHYAFQTKGMAEFRLGHYQEAVTWFNRSQDRQDPYRDTIADFFLAMAYHKLDNKSAETEAAMKAGINHLKLLPQAEKQVIGTLNFMDWAICHQLHREAEEKLHGKTDEPAPRPAQPAPLK